MLNEWIRNLPLCDLQEIASKARPGTLRALAQTELNRRQFIIASAA
ncbi:MAG TPA: hypothetical protein VM661_03575 [Candidatus Sulfotelmatobacter sp.]|jgi:hypothetical protein|nr:hypothetical protein [Candidatus Sulfotelmatobacter sp.]